MITAKKLSDDKAVWEVDLTHLDGVGALEGEVWHATFSGVDGDVSARDVFASSKTCIVTSDPGWTGTDECVVKDDHGNEASGSVTFG